MPRLSTVIFWLFWAFVIWFIATNPSGAAHFAHSIGSWLSQAAHGISTFLTSI